MDAKKALPKKDQNKGNKVTQALAFISKLYQLEQVIKDFSPQDKAARRQADAEPTLKKCQCQHKTDGMDPLLESAWVMSISRSAKTI